MNIEFGSVVLRPPLVTLLSLVLVLGVPSLAGADGSGAKRGKSSQKAAKQKRARAKLHQKGQKLQKGRQLRVPQRGKSRSRRQSHQLRRKSRQRQRKSQSWRARHLRAQKRASSGRSRRPRYTNGNPLALLPKKGAELKVAVLGRAVAESKLDAGLKKSMTTLGKDVARRGGVLITGAAPGVPHIAARAAHESGAFTIGVSAAGTPKEHEVDYSAPHDNLNIVQLAGTGPRLMGFIEREAPLLKHADIAVYAHGATGTLGELLAAMHEPKVIALLEGTGGVGGNAREKILPHIGKGKAIVVHDTDPQRLMEKATRAHEKLARQKKKKEKQWRQRDSTIAKRKRALQKNAWRRGKRRREARDVRARRRRDPSKQRSRPIDSKYISGRDVYAFLGSEHKLSSTDTRNVNRLADLVAGKGERARTLVTPMRRGLTGRFVRRVREQSQKRGSLVETLGVSSAGSAAEHKQMKKPKEGYSSVHYTGKGSGIGEFAAQRAVVEHANVVFVAGGDYKTLSGVIFASYAPTVVAVLETKGMSGKLKKDILAPLKKDPHAKVIFDKNPQRLYQRAVREAEVLRSQEKKDLITAAE